MLTLPKSLKIYATTMPCDMRKQADGLLGMVNTVLGRPAAQHELYLFWSRRKDLIKVLYLDPTGVCVFAKRSGSPARVKRAVGFSTFSFHCTTLMRHFARKCSACVSVFGSLLRSSSVANASPSSTSG